MLSIDVLSVPDELEGFLEHSQQPLDVVRLRVVAHEADAPDLAGGSSETAGNLDAVLAHQVRSHRLPIHVRRNANASYSRKTQFRILDKELQAKILKSLIKKLGAGFVAFPAFLQSFFRNDGESFPQAVHGRNGSGVMVLP